MLIQNDTIINTLLQDITENICNIQNNPTPVFYGDGVHLYLISYDQDIMINLENNIIFFNNGDNALMIDIDMLSKDDHIYCDECFLEFIKDALEKDKLIKKRLEIESKIQDYKEQLEEINDYLDIEEDDLPFN